MRRAGIPGLGTWFTSKELAGGGPLIDLGVHVLDMALYLMGNPRVVSVSAATYAELGPQGKGDWTGARFQSIQSESRTRSRTWRPPSSASTDGATLQLETSWAAYTGVTDEFGVTPLRQQGGAEIHVKDYAQTGTLTIFGEFGGVPTDAAPRLQKTPAATPRSSAASSTPSSTARRSAPAARKGSIAPA